MASHAQSREEAKNGLLFMQELLDLMKNEKLFETYPDHSSPLSIIPLIKTPDKTLFRLPVAAAQFGRQLHHTTGVKHLLSLEFHSFIPFRYSLWQR